MSESERWDEDLPTGGNHIALCSGGLESTVASHIAVRWGPCDMMALLDTGTMAEPNRRFVERVADAFGVTLTTLVVATLVGVAVIGSAIIAGDVEFLANADGE